MIKILLIYIQYSLYHIINIKSNFSQTKPKTKEEAKLETHNQFIDIQIPLSGVEVMKMLLKLQQILHSLTVTYRQSTML